MIIVSFSAGTQLEFPPSGFSLQWYRSFFGDPSWNKAALSSLEIAISVTVISIIFGTLAVYGLCRSTPISRNVLKLILLAPITFLVIVVGIAAYLDLVSFGLVGTKTGIVLTHSIGAMSYVVVVVAATLAKFDTSLEQAQEYAGRVLPDIHTGDSAFDPAGYSRLGGVCLPPFIRRSGHILAGQRSIRRRGGVAAHASAGSLARCPVLHLVAIKMQNASSPHARPGLKPHYS
ncbi:ABC transporter permease [Mesorhizobium sp. IMUNJ 23033]|uniref:ABC transporter permease n=1 Tax=Mesorhizobium sp. IMUNJ 23033 TaxID=3378039 RepID=UPI00384ED71F